MNACQIEMDTKAHYVRMAEDSAAYESAYNDYASSAFNADSEFLWCEERLGEHGSFAMTVAAAIRDTPDNAELGLIVRALANQAIGKAADWYASNHDNDDLPELLKHQAI